VSLTNRNSGLVDDEDDDEDDLEEEFLVLILNETEIDSVV
jgi:hypothetical protein